MLYVRGHHQWLIEEHLFAFYWTDSVPDPVFLNIPLIPLKAGTFAKLLKGRAASLDVALSNSSFKAVLLIRLIPNFPYDVQNYGLGFSQVRFVPFVLATALGIIPASFAFVYLGYSLTDPAQLWKLLVAVLVIVGLMLAQGAWRKRHA